MNPEQTPLDPTMFAPSQSRDPRFTVKDRYIEMFNVPEDHPERELDFFHRQMNDELNSVENAAQNLVDFPDADWNVRMCMARQASDEARHVLMFRKIFEDWRQGIADDHPETSDADWEGLWGNLFGGDDALWSVPDTFLPTIETPLLVLQGDDTYHPRSASRLLAAAPTATLVERWKEPTDQPAARATVDDFLTLHAA